MNPRQLPPPRGRTPSGHDVPIPEAVFVALAGIQGDVRAIAQAQAAGQAATDQKISEIGKDVATLKAADRSHMVKIIGALATAVAAVIGGQRALSPATPPERTVVSESALSVDLGACETLPESNQPACVQAAYDRDQSRKLARGRR